MAGLPRPGRSSSRGNAPSIFMAIAVAATVLWSSLDFEFANSSNLGIIPSITIRRFHNATSGIDVGLGPVKFRSVSCQCILPRNHWDVECVGAGESSDHVGFISAFLPTEPYDLVGNGSISLRNREGILSQDDLLLLNGKHNNGSRPFSSATCPSGELDERNASSKVAFIHAVKPQVFRGIYHQFLNGLIPHISFIMGICDGTISVEHFDPAGIDRWVVNQGTWGNDKLPSYMTRVWDAVRPRLRSVCGNSEATFQLTRSPRDEVKDGKDPYPPEVLEKWESARLFVYNNWATFYVLRPSHAEIIRRAVMEMTDSHKHAKKRRHVLKVAVVDRLPEKNRNIVYDNTSGDGRALLGDTIKYLNTTLAPNGKNYTVTDTYYTNDLGSEGSHQMDVLQDIDLVLWTHGQQQSNVIWLPECAIAVDLLGNRQYMSMYDVAGLQTGHIFGYVYSLVGVDLLLEPNQAGLSLWPVDAGSGGRKIIRNQPVHVNFTSVTEILPDLLDLRWQCLANGIDKLKAPNVTGMHLNFATGKMNTFGTPYNIHSDSRK